MSTQKYLCMYRGAPSQNKTSPAQMQEMFAAFNGWKEKFKANILDMGSKLKPSGKVLTASGQPARRIRSPHRDWSSISSAANMGGLSPS